MPDRTGRLSAGECLDPEVLSAYVDGKLDVHERAEVEAHLASCADCYEVMSEVLHIQEGIPAARPAAPFTPPALGPADAAPALSSTPPAWAAPKRRDASVPVLRPSGDPVVRGVFGRRKAVWGVAGGLLAAAAALVLVVRLQPTWWTGGVDPRLADLVEAVGEERTVEARLTGGFKYGPLRSPMRSGGRVGPTDNWSLLAAAGRIREVAEKDPTPDNTHAAGVASLLVGDLDASVRLLESAAQVNTTQPALLNSLGAAYFSRYGARGRADDLPRALESVERALTFAPESPEALFNRALLLEALGARRAAATAWEVYLGVDARSPWADEARKHLSALQSSLVQPGIPEPFSSSVPVGDREPGPSTSSRAEFGIDRLSRWGVARESHPNHTAGAPGSVGALLNELEVLFRATGDSMWKDEADVIRALAAKDQDDALDAAGRGYRCLATARALRARADTAGLTLLARDCRAELARATSVLEAWAILDLSIGEFYQGRASEAAALARLLLEHDRFRSFRTVMGRAHYVLGGLAYVDARFSDAFEHLHSATHLLIGLGEEEPLASVHDVLGAAHLAIGNRQSAWQSYIAALRVAPESPESLGGYATRNSVALASLRLGFPRVAKILFEQGLEDARVVDGMSRIAESHYELARTYAALGDHEAATTHAIESRQTLALVTDFGLKRRIEAELLLLESEFALHGNNVEALEKAVTARSLFESFGTRIESARLLHYEAIARIGLSGDRGPARDALNQAMALLESQESSLQQRQMRITFRDKVWDVYSDAIELAVSEGDTSAAMQIFDRARSRRIRMFQQHGSRPADEPIRAGTAVIAFHSAKGALYRWVLTQNSVDFRSVAILRAELDSLVWRVRLDVMGEGSSDSAAIRSLSALLFADMPAAGDAAGYWVLVPDGPLYRVPFGVLRVGSRNSQVLDDHELAISSTIDGYRVVQDESAVFSPSRVAVVTAPDNPLAHVPKLPAAMTEGERIGQLYQEASVVSGSQATTEALMRALSVPGVVHFAGHAVADASMPWLAYLVVSPSQSDVDGLVQASDMEHLQARSMVVVLAACSTVEGFEFRGEGLASMASTFVGAGVPWVLGTLWDVPDEQASEFFVMLHQGLAAGMRPPAAVRTAQQMARAASAPRAVWASIVVMVG